MTAYVLGAGFSRQIGEMPLLGELTDPLIEAMVQRKRTFDGREDPRDFERAALRKTLSQFENNLELWLSYLAVDQPWLDYAENAENRATFARATADIAEIIRTREYGYRLGVTFADEPSWLRKLGEKLGRSNGIITFNYDTFAERLLAETGVTTPWEDLYVLPLVTPRGQTDGRWFETYYRMAGFDLSIMKLHGSVNWKYGGPQAAATDAIHFIDLRHRGWSSGSGEPGFWASQKPYLQPLIIPPTATKGPYYELLPLRHQWRYARKVIEVNEDLVFIGYSLPVTDQAVSNLFSTSFHTEQRSRKITVVDRSAAPVKRLRTLFKGREVEIDDTYADRDDAIEAYANS